MTPKFRGPACLFLTDARTAGCKSVFATLTEYYYFVYPRHNVITAGDRDSGRSYTLQ